MDKLLCSDKYICSGKSIIVFSNPSNKWFVCLHKIVYLFDQIVYLFDYFVQTIEYLFEGLLKQIVQRSETIAYYV